MIHQTVVVLLVGGAAVVVLATDRLIASARYFYLSFVLAEVYPLCKFFCNSHNGIILGNYPHRSKAFILIKLGGKLVVAITLATSTRAYWVRDTVLLAVCCLYYSLNCLGEILTNKIVVVD